MLDADYLPVTQSVETSIILPNAFLISTCLISSFQFCAIGLYEFI